MKYVFLFLALLPAMIVSFIKHNPPQKIVKISDLEALSGDIAELRKIAIDTNRKVTAAIPKAAKKNPCPRCPSWQVQEVKPCRKFPIGMHGDAKENRCAKTN